MAKLTLTTISDLDNEISACNTINTNNDLIELAMQKTLSRDGTTPNTMSAPLDMNGFDIINIGTVTEADGITFSINNVKNYGAVGDGTTDDTTAVAAAEAAVTLSGPVFLPEGIYDTTTGQSAFRGPFWGFGQVRDSANNLRAPWFSAITSAPTRGDQTSVLTAFNGNLSGVQLAMEHRVTGSSTAGTPTSGYEVRSECSPIFIYHYSEAGHNQSTSGNSGRTGQAILDLNFAHTGQGDFGGIYVNGLITGTKPGATSFLANPAGAIIYGQVFNAVAGGYLNIIEMNANDGGFRAAAIGAVFNFARSVATATLSEVWMGIRPQASALACDVIYSGGGLWKRGLDLSATTFDANLAAITLASNSRIYWNSVASGDVAWSQTLGDDWVEFNSSINAFSFVVDNSSRFQVYSNQVVSTTTTILQGNVIVNHTAALAIGPSVTPKLQALATDATASVGIARYSNGATGGSFILSKSRAAAIGTNTVVQNGDTLGLIRFCGADGTNFVDGAYIEGRVTATPGTTDMPSSLILFTSPDGSATPLERLRITDTGRITSITPLGGIGYAAGAGAAVTQITSRTTGVTINNVCGAITMFNAAGSATASTFVVTNSTVEATDTIRLVQRSGTNLYNFIVTAVAAGSFNITFFTTGGTASDAPVINFSVFRAAQS